MRITVTAFLVALVAGIFGSLAAAAPARNTLSFDHDWRFVKSDPKNGQAVDLDDSSWKTIDVPHDWSIEGPFDQTNPAGGAGAFLPGGVGFYRKHFTLPADAAQRRVFVEFDGVMANSDVWINGTHLGKRPYGYISFQYELTGHLTFGDDRPNVLAVRADDSAQPASRWYSGAGIYRHVRLVVTNPVHVDQWGTFVSTPKVAADLATVHVQSAVINQSDSSASVGLHIAITDPSGKEVGTADIAPQAIAAGKSADFQQDVSIANPKLWDLDHPNLYQARVEVRSSGETLDDDVATFGIREARFVAESGFWLNGKNMKLKGVCLHHDASAFGAAVPVGAWERRLAALRELGVNAIRTAHNPPAPEFLDLCDRMGFLVMDEAFDCWTVAKNRYDYHLFFDDWCDVDVRDMVRRDRNHASVIIYSAGNEIHDTPNAELAEEILSLLVKTFHENDPTRPVTQALFRPNVSHDYEDGLADMLDVVGQNYRDNELAAAHVQKPTRKILGTENIHDRTTWIALRDNPALAGQFLWSGVDYLGEARVWPAVASSSGLLDRTDTAKPLGMQRASWWSDKPMVFASRRTAPTATSPTDPGYEPAATRRRPQTLFPDWNPGQTAPHEENVEVYSNCESVELFLNGKSLGSKAIPADDNSRNWRVNYEPGTLKAVASNKGKIVANYELRTAGKAAKIVLSADRDHLKSNWDDVSFVTAAVVDENGVMVPTAGDEISFDIKGSGVIAAVDSGDNRTHEPFQAKQRHAFQGRCFAIVKGTDAGMTTVSATAPGLAGGSIEIAVDPK